MAGVRQNKRPNRDPGTLNGQLPRSPATGPTTSNGQSVAPKAAPGKAAVKPAGATFRRSNGRRRISRKQLAEPIGQAADRCGGRPLARRLKQLKRLLAGKPRDDRRLTQVGIRLADCLDAGLQTTVAADRWVACEAVAWGVAWLIRNQRNDGAAGGLLERLVQLARSAAAEDSGDAADAAAFAVVLAGLFDDVEGCRALGPEVRARLERAIAARVGPAGGIRGSSSAEMLASLCGWLRCRELIGLTGGPPLSKASNELLDRAVVAALPLLGRGGRVVEAAPVSAAACDPLLRAAGRSRRRVAATAAAVCEGRDLAGNLRFDDKGLLDGSFHDAEAAVAVLRSGWTRDAVRVLVSYQTPVPQLEIAVGSRLVVAGPWEQAVQQGGEPAAVVGDWRPSRWQADDEAVYFEMIVDLAGGRRLERSVMVLVEDNIVMLGDAVVLPSAGYGDRPPELAEPLVFRASLSLPATIAIETCDETTEVFGCDLKPRFLALPLGLGEWRQGGSRQGGLTAAAGRLCLEQTSAAGRLYAPLWIDLDSRRLKQLRHRPEETQRTWRQLTVADTREQLAGDQAVGYRVQEGLDQWLVYRTLDEARNRTVLGCNVSCEFFAGRFGSDGEAVRSLEIFDDSESG